MTKTFVLFSGLDANPVGASSGQRGLWVTDGTAQGTYEIQVSGAYAYGVTPNDLTYYNGEVLFRGGGADGLNGLWVTNGTPQGTYEITGINGASPAGILNVQSPDMTIFNNDVFFSGQNSNGQNGLWVTNGTAQGTHELIGITGASPFGLYITDLVVFNGQLYFNGLDATGFLEPWVSDGTAQGTHEVSTIDRGLSLGDNPYFTVFKGELFFSDGMELWKTDGTTGGTVEMFPQGTGPHHVEGLTAFNNQLLFFADNGSEVGLWATDGTAQDTRELAGMSSSGISSVNNFSMTVFNGEVLFPQFDAAGNVGLWVSDGTPQGTRELTGITGASPSGLNPSDMVVFDGEVLFSGNDAAGQRGLWITDGTARGTHEVVGVNGANPLFGLEPFDLAVFGATTDAPPVIDGANSVLSGTISKADPLGEDTAYGKIIFQDADASDRPTATVVDKSVVAKDAYGNVQTLDPSLVSAIKQAFTPVPEAANTNNGTVDWSFVLANSSLGSLPAGYSVKLTATILIDDHNGGTVSRAITVNLVSDPLIAYTDLTPRHPTPTDVVQAALQYKYSLWDSDNCTGLVWAVTEAVGQPFGHPGTPNITFDSQHVPDPPSGYFIPVPPNASSDQYGEWLTVETSDWASMVQPGDLVRIPATHIPNDPLEEGHSFIVVDKDSQGNWLVIDNTDPNHGSGTGPIIVSEHAFNPNGSFGPEVLHANVAYVSRLESGPSSSFTGPTVTGTAGHSLVFGNTAAFLDGSALQHQIITAGNGGDVVTAGSYDQITLGNGNDSVEAGDNDTINLKNGNDQIFSGASTNVKVDDGTDTITVGSKSTIVAGNGNDAISAGDHCNIVVGNGNDTISAGAGSTIILGNGTDTVTAIASQISAGKGSDTFVFKGNFGQESITHFDSQKDIVQLDHSVFHDIAAVVADMKPQGANVVLSDGHGNEITFVGKTIAELTAHQSDFHFL